MKISFPLEQALIGQQNRLLKLTTPFDNDVLLPQRVLAQERLGRGYEYTVDVVSIRPNIELKKLIAQPVTLWVQQADRAYLPKHGYVCTAKRLHIIDLNSSTRQLSPNYIDQLLI